MAFEKDDLGRVQVVLDFQKHCVACEFNGYCKNGTKVGQMQNGCPALLAVVNEQALLIKDLYARLDYVERQRRDEWVK